MRIEGMKGGTNTPGVPQSAFAMPPGYFMRYDAPAAILAPYVSGYAVYGAVDRSPMINCFLPGPPMICVLTDAGPVGVTIRYRSFDPVPDVAFYGPTTQATRIMTRGGINVGIGLTALGWASLSSLPVYLYRNGVFEAATVLPHGLASRLRRAVDSVDDDAALAPALDKALTGQFARVDPAADKIATLSEQLLQNGLIRVADVVATTGLRTSQLRDLCAAKFGLPTKQLLSRARFLRVYARWKVSGMERASGILDGNYYDVSHFLRDARIFLGTTPARFQKEGTLFLDASLRARAAVLGATSHALHRQVAM